MVMKVISAPINSIHPYPGNPRKNASAIAPVAKSMKEFGQQQIVLVDSNRVIIVGHTRWEAAKSLGWDRIDIVVNTTLTPEQIKAYRLIDNKTGELAEWDEGKLMAEIADLLDGGFDLKGFGFSNEDLMMGEPQDPKPDNRWVEDFTVLPKAKPVWILMMVDEAEGPALVSELRAREIPGAVIHYSGEAPP